MIRGRLKLWILALPWFIEYLGIALNVLVVSVNKGVMPFIQAPWMDFDPGQDQVHAILQHTHHLKFLADWIQLPFIQGTASPGDMLLWFGGWLIVPATAFWLGYISRDEETR